MPKQPTDRRAALMTAVMMTAGAAALAPASGAAVAQAAELRGTVRFESGVALPKGELSVYLEDQAIPDAAKRRLAAARIESAGGSDAIAFSLPYPAGVAATSTQRIVARLERTDGWLIARGSSRVAGGSPVDITLNPVTY